MMSKNYLIPCTVCFALTMVAFLVALMNPAIGYEVSIYASTPLTVWVLIILSIVICVLLLVKEAISGKGKRWLLPLGILVANGSLVLMMAMVRGYYSIDGDTLMHIGYVRDLVNGIISRQNVYPVLHVIPTLLNILGLPIPLATNLSSVVFYVVYVVTFYVLARMLWGDRRKVIIATTLSAMLFSPASIGLAGTLVGVAMLPLLLIILLRLKRNFNALNVVVLFVYMAVVSMMHPLALEVACIALVIICFLPTENRWKLIGLTVVLLPLVVWWYAYWYHIDSITILLGQAMRSISVAEVGNRTAMGINNVMPIVPITPEASSFSLLPSMSGIEATQDVGNFSGLSVILRRYGAAMLLGGLAVVSLVLSKCIKGFRQNDLLMYFGGMFVVLNIMWIAGWYLEVKMYELVLSRMLHWIPPLSIILTVPLLAYLIDLQKRRRLIVTAVSAILVVLSVGALFQLYPSPISGVSSPLATNQQTKGISWLVENGEEDVPIIYLHVRETSRIVAAIYGAERCVLNPKAYWVSEDLFNREGFSYNNKPSIGYGYPEDFYAVVIKLIKLLPTWEKDKLYLLKTDPAATLVYKDGDEIEIYYVRHIE